STTLRAPVEKSVVMTNARFCGTMNGPVMPWSVEQPGTSAAARTSATSPRCTGRSGLRSGRGLMDSSRSTVRLSFRAEPDIARGEEGPTRERKAGDVGHPVVAEILALHRQPQAGGVGSERKRAPDQEAIGDVLQIGAVEEVIGDVFDTRAGAPPPAALIEAQR